MILVDSSVVIPFNRTADPKLGRLFGSFPVAFCGIVRAEVLHGVQTQLEKQRSLTILNSFTDLSLPDSIWDMVGDNLATLRASGFTFSFQDCVLATLAIEEVIELWTRDKHFALI